MADRQIPWLRVLAEGLVIIVSILLAFGIDAWWEGRQERERESAALRELHADLLADSTDLDTMFRRMERWDESALWVWRRLDDASVPADSTLQRLWVMATFQLYQPVASAYVGLKDGGELALISDAEVRRQIVEYYEVHQPYMLQFDALMRGLHDDVSSLVLDHTEPTLAEAATSFWRPPGLTFGTSWEAFRTDPRTSPTVSYFGVVAGNWAARIEGVLEANSSLRRSIESSVEN